MVWLHRLSLSLPFLVLFLSYPVPAAAQQPLDRPLRVYLDCNGFYCDQDFYIEEVSWVDFVRNRQDADVHVLIARQSTAGGGWAYALEFGGRGAFDGQTITLEKTTASDATEAMVRDTLAKAIELGLAPFASGTPAPPQVQIHPPAASADTAHPPDPWHRWTFAISASGYVQGESQQKFLYGSGSLSAAHVTDTWKIELMGAGSYNRSEFDIDNTTYSQESYSGRARVARSVGGRWAVGGVGTWRKSTYYNYDTSARLAPAVEYDVFPYSVSVRRLLTFLYSIGPRYNDYTDVTIYDKKSETILEQAAVLTYDIKQPWGNIDLALQGTHYIARLSGGPRWPSVQYNAELSGNFEVRLFKGLSASVQGYVQAVGGQIQLPAGGLTKDQILTQQRELATSYRYFAYFSLSYRFGSIYSRVVNPRFDNLY